ncbi:protein Tob1 isoform X3 [Drosophila albomicans]|uniref:Protein Tob1 isoform X3 n=1 Tax=Drosophila albomicans TaxID=7291 RepID=A0A6P8XT23_DROAB|nr:protein Tob1 isoform X3 [Drosophila albomicans]
MHIEIQVALNFVISYLYNKLPRRRVNIFGEELEKALRDKFQGHWYPEKPFKGSAYRCLKTGDPIDSVLARAARESGVPITDILENLPNELSVWVDPGEVSYRIGEKGAVKILYTENNENHEDSHSADREVRKTFNPEAQCFRPIDAVNTTMNNLSLSPKELPLPASATGATTTTGGANGAIGATAAGGGGVVAGAAAVGGGGGGGSAATTMPTLPPLPATVATASGSSPHSTAGAAQAGSSSSPTAYAKGSPNPNPHPHGHPHAHPHSHSHQHQHQHQHGHQHAQHPHPHSHNHNPHGHGHANANGSGSSGGSLAGSNNNASAAAAAATAAAFVQRAAQAPLTFTTATFAQTKFGSTKLKTSSKRTNRKKM